MREGCVRGGGSAFLGICCQGIEHLRAPLKANSSVFLFSLHFFVAAFLVLLLFL